MPERKQPGMQRLPRKRLDALPLCFGQSVRLGAERLAVVWIADHRIADMGHMHADLMRPPGFQSAFDERGLRDIGAAFAEAFEHSVMGDGVACIVPVFWHDCTPHAIGRTAERSVDGAGHARGNAPDQRDVGALQVAGGAVVGKGFRQSAMRGIRLGNDHDAAGLLVEPVDDARPLYPADAGQAFPAMMDQRIDERTGPVARAGMHNKAGRLVDDDQIGILIKNVELYRFALWRGWLRLRQHNRNAIAFGHFALRFKGDVFADPHRALTDQHLHTVARKISAKCRGKPLVEALCQQIRVRLPALSIQSLLRYQRRSFSSQLEISPMARPADDDSEDKPLDPAVERVRRKLVRFVAINLGLLFIALMAVVAALVYKSGQTTPQGAAASAIPSPAEGGVLIGEIELPAGAKLLSHSLSGDRLTLDAELADGTRTIFLYDIAGKRIIGQFAVKSR